ncbi:MAG TPA: Uma2 family endonuclease [Ktedonobacteraceae bacterium]|jgi:Uma2 family endonuclease
MFDPRQMYTLDEYWRLVESFPEKKYEYIDGDIRMLTGESPAYAQIAANIGSLLAIALRSQECNVYSSDAALQLTENRVYFPDVSVSCNPADWTRKRALEAPSVVVEVISPSTEKTDKAEKLEVYQRYPTIQEILLVDSRRRHVAHYHRVGISTWKDTLYDQDDEVIDLASIGVSLAVREMYLKVYLELEEE